MGWCPHGIKFQRHSSGLASRSPMGEHEQVGSYDSKVLSPQCNFQRQTLSSRYCVSGTGLSQTSVPSVGTSGVFSLSSPTPGARIIFHPALAPTITKKPVLRAAATLGCQGGPGAVRTQELVSVQPSVPPTQSNPLLAGLPLDPEYSVPCYRSLPSSSNVCSPAHKKCDKCCGSCSPAHKKCDKCCGSCSPAHKKCDKCCGSCSPAHKKCDKCCGSCSPAHKKCDKCCGTSSEKTSEYTFHWSKNPEPETSQPTAPENTVTAEAWRPGRDTGCQSHGSPSTPCSDSQEPCNDQDLPKSHNSNTKTLLMPFAPKEEGHYLSPSRSEGSEAVCSQGHPPCLPQRCTSERVQAGAEKPLETSCSKTKVKSTTMIPDCQKLLRCELESLKCQLQAQTKAFEFLNHSVTLLEKESCLQQIKIQQLEEVLGPASHQGDKEGHKWDVVEGRQELYEALAQGLQGLQKTLHDNEEVQWARTTRCLQLLAQEIRDSKKFLWEELELVREEVTFIYQKLQAQEQEITENLVNIQKMQKTQVKCRKVLTKMKQQGYETANWLETEELPPGCSGSWRDNLQKELGDIWSAVHVLQNSFDGLAISSGGRPRAANLRGYKGHRCLSPPLPCWDSDSDTDQGPPQLLLSKSHSSFPPA